MKRFGGALAVAIIAALPIIANTYQQEVLIQVGVYALLALGLNVVVGMAGMLDLGYVAFWAIGAYTMAILSGSGPVDVAHLNMWTILPLGVVLAAFAGVVLGTPVLRLRGDYLAIVTLGFGEIIRITASNLDRVTGGAPGINQVPHPSILTFEFGVTPWPYYELLLALVLLMMVLLRQLRASAIGRAWFAMREDEEAARAMGINTFRMKLWAFAIGASTAGIAGVVHAAEINFVSPASFPVTVSFLVVAMVVLGGMGSIPGAVLGAATLVIVPELTRRFESWRYLVFGAALVAMMVFRPQGLIPAKRERIAAESRSGGPDDAE